MGYVAMQHMLAEKNVDCYPPKTRIQKRHHPPCDGWRNGRWRQASTAPSPRAAAE